MPSCSERLWCSQEACKCKTTELQLLYIFANDIINRGAILCTYTYTLSAFKRMNKRKDLHHLPYFSIQIPWFLHNSIFDLWLPFYLIFTSLYTFTHLVILLWNVIFSKVFDSSISRYRSTDPPHEDPFLSEFQHNVTEPLIMTNIYILLSKIKR